MHRPFIATKLQKRLIMKFLITDCSRISGYGGSWMNSCAPEEDYIIIPGGIWLNNKSKIWRESLPNNVLFLTALHLPFLFWRIPALKHKWLKFILNKLLDHVQEWNIYLIWYLLLKFYQIWT